MTLYIDLEWTPSLIGFLEDLQLSPTGVRGRVYAEEGKVRHLSVAPDGLTIRAAVTGSRPKPYMTTLILEGDHYLSAECSCPMGIDCKHGFALALTLAGGAYRNGSKFQDDLRRLLPVEWRNYAWNPPADLFDGVRELFVRVAESQPAAVAAPTPAAPPPTISRQAALGKKLKGKRSGRSVALLKPPPPPLEPARPWWERLWEATNDQARERFLLEACESRLGTARYFYPYGFISNLKALKNNAAILVKLEEELKKEAGVERRPLHPPEPQYLEFVASPPVQEAYRQYRQALCQGYLREWVEKAAPAATPKPPDCTLELYWKLMPLPAGIDLLAFELLITTGKMDRRRRKPQAIKQLYTDLVYGKRTATPLMREVVDWLSGKTQIISRYDYSKPDWGDEGIIPVDNLLAWISAWGGRGVLHWEDGAPVAYDPRPARLCIERTPQGEDLWTVEFPAAPGANGQSAPETAPLSEAEIFGDDSVREIPAYYTSHPEYKGERFFVRRGATIHPLDAGGMDHRALGAARQMRTAPVEMILKRPSGMRLLRRLVRESTAGPGAESPAGLVREMAVQPVIELKSLRNEWISVAAYGRSAEGRVFLRDPLGEWAAIPDGRDARLWLAESPFSFTTEGALTPLNEETVQPGELPAAEAPAGAEAPPEAQTQPAPPPDQPQPLIVLPRMAELEPVEAWLRALIPPQTAPLQHGQERVSFQWPATPEATAALLRRWSERPPGATYLGNADFLKLVTPAARPGLKVSVEPAGVDWLQVSVEMEHDLERLSARAIRAILASSTDALLRLPDGRFYRREGLEEYERELAAIEEAGLAPGRKGQRLHAFHLAGEAGQKLVELGGQDERLAELARSVRKLVGGFKGIPASPVHPETAACLRPYQRAGADFLAWSCRGFGGALLADDMGLGKTLQVLAALTALQKESKGKKKPSLVICPASVAHNWQREARRFAPHLKTLVIERGAERKVMWERFGEFDLVIKNYALTRRDADVIRKYDWLMVCVDEAQAIKNPGSDIAAVVKSLPAKYHVALTGTPIENRLSDLVSIMEFATPGFLPPLEGSEEESARRLRAFLRPVLLRRLKRDVAPELPDRIEERIDCAMTENQRLAYLAEVKRTREMLREVKGERVAGAARIQILAALTRLRQICCDPALLSLKSLGSGKVEELMGLLPPILEAGNKILLFSQFVRMLNRLHERLEKEKIPTWMLTGHTPPARRQELVDSFEKDPTPGVFLISLKAGGTGLNLVSASHVVLFDPWWNPAVEAQAIDRTHRIGQDKTVLAFRLVTEGTIEERILELQEKKRGLVQNVLEEDAFNRTLTREDFEFLLR